MSEPANTTPDTDDSINVTALKILKALKEGAIGGLPNQSGHGGEFLTTDGSSASWSAVPVVTGNTVWVSKDGSDSGARERLDKPFLTLAAAETAASSGDTIVVLPGAYTVTGSIAKNGVNWHLMPGVTITWAEGSSTGTGIFDDGDTAMSYRVTGAGNLIRTATDGFIGETWAVRTNHANSVVDIECNDITCDDGGGGFSMCVRGSKGRLRVHCRDLYSNSISQDGGYATWWDNGDMEVRGRYAWGASGAHYSQVADAPTGDCDI